MQWFEMRFLIHPHSNSYVQFLGEVTSEAYELVERGLLNEDEFRDFTFTNAARMWSSMNPDFFKGTVVESEAAKVLAAKTRRGAANDASATLRNDAAK